MDTEDDLYRQLQRHLDRMPVGYPAAESGADIRVLKHLFSPEEAKVALHLSAVPEPLGRIYRRVRKTGMSIEGLEQTLDRMVQNGTIIGGRLVAGKGGEKRYGKAQLAIGMYEFQVDRLTKELAEEVSQYMQGEFAEALHSKKTSQMRTIPIGESVTPERHVGNYDSIRDIIQASDGPFGLLNCICRQGKDLLGDPCKQTDNRRVCLILDAVAQIYIDGGVAQALTKEETLRLLTQADEAGMVLQPENTQHPRFVCFCCGCCCAILTSVKKFPRPAEYIHTNFYAQSDPELCTGCETCAARCQMEALTLVDDVTEVNLDRCIGCGLCVSTCPSGAMQLHMKDKEKVPPKDTASLYKTIMTERFGTWGTLKTMGKIALRMKV